MDRSSNRGLHTLVIAAAVTAFCSVTSQAAINYNVTGSTYSQNFNTLPIATENASLGTTPAGWIDDSATPAANQFSIVGWYAYHSTTQSEGGANGNQRMRIGAGTTNTGAFWDFGASGSTERALGNIGSNTTMSSGGQIVYGARFTNNTTDTLDEFSLNYVVEQWRDGGTTTTGSLAQAVTFAYKINAANIQDTGFTDVAALGFTSPTFGATAGTALDGNAAVNQMNKSGTVSGFSWAPGTDLWIRWSDPDHASNDHGLAIDNVNFSASVGIPEPASLGLLSVGALALIRRRR
jgi:hypothetical protein